LIALEGTTLKEKKKMQAGNRGERRGEEPPSGIEAKDAGVLSGKRGFAKGTRAWEKFLGGLGGEPYNENEMRRVEIGLLRPKKLLLGKATSGERKGIGREFGLSKWN